MPSVVGEIVDGKAALQEGSSEEGHLQCCVSRLAHRAGAVYNNGGI